MTLMLLQTSMGHKRRSWQNDSLGLHSFSLLLSINWKWMVTIIIIILFCERNRADLKGGGWVNEDSELFFWGQPRSLLLLLFCLNITFLYSVVYQCKNVLLLQPFQMTNVNLLWNILDAIECVIVTGLKLQSVFTG